MLKLNHRWKSQHLECISSQKTRAIEWVCTFQLNEIALRVEKKKTGNKLKTQWKSKRNKREDIITSARFWKKSGKIAVAEERDEEIEKGRMEDKD